VPGKRRRGRAPRPQPQPQPNVTPGPVIGAPAKTRRELRAERRRQKRRRLGAVGIAGVVVVGLIIAAAVGFGVKQATSSGHKKQTGQTTVLLSVAGSDGTATETALLAHDDSTHHGVELLIPGRVLTQVCGFGNQQLGQILALPNGQALSRTTVSNLLGGVTVDGSWVLTTTQLAKLVDTLGGVTVDVDTDVIQQRPDGSRVLAISKGDGQHLNGSQAAAYATYLRAGEDALANLVRLQNVLDGIEAALPRTASAVVKDLQALGSGGASSLGADRLAAVLVGLAADARHDNVLPTSLPVIKIDSGGALPSYRVDTQQVATFVNANLSASLPASARVARKSVFIQNGVGTPGLASSACDKLVKAGYAFAGSGNATTFNHNQSLVLVFDHSIATARLGDSVAQALGLTVNDVRVQDSGQNVADVIVILGKDYKP
jgi:LytR cell envelope-related transcriptional attenuator/cell envelope-related transcriptional attenuator-like protein